jgi:hypothetical protein
MMKNKVKSFSRMMEMFGWLKKCCWIFRNINISSTAMRTPILLKCSDCCAWNVNNYFSFFAYLHPSRRLAFTVFKVEKPILISNLFRIFSNHFRSYRILSLFIDVKLIMSRAPTMRCKIVN